MKKVLMLVVIAALLFGGAAYAQPPTEITADESTVTVTVDDIIAVNDQLKEYDTEIDLLAQLVYAEARGVDSRMEQAAVVWVALNRVDATGETIREVVTARYQFAYKRGLPIQEKFKDIARDVLIRWLLEKRGITDVGRVIPTNYIYFAGHGGHNWFRDKFLHGTYWDWDYKDPYEEEK